MGSATTSSAGQSFFRGSLQALAFQGVSEIGLHLDLPPPFTNALAVVAGTMTGAAIDPSLSISQGLQQLAPQLASDFALSGFVALGNKIGLDPRLTGLFSTPIASLASGFTAGLVGNSKNIFNVIKNSFLNKDMLARSISVGADMLGLGNGFTAGAITGAVSQLLGSPDLLKNAANLVGNLLLNPTATISAVGGAIQDSFVSINEKIQEKGLLGALTQMATKIFNRQTQEEIHQAGSLDGFLSGSGFDTTFNNQAAKEYQIGSSTSIFTDLLGNMIGKSENGITQAGTFGLNAAGKFGLISGGIFANLLGGFAFAGTVDGGALVGGEMLQGNEKILQFSGTGLDGQDWVGFQLPQDNPQTPQGQSEFSWSSVVFSLVNLAADFVIKDGRFQEVIQNGKKGTGYAGDRLKVEKK